MQGDQQHGHKGQHRCGTFGRGCGVHEATSPAAKTCELAATSGKRNEALSSRETQLRKMIGQSVNLISKERSLCAETLNSPMFEIISTYNCEGRGAVTTDLLGAPMTAQEGVDGQKPVCIRRQSRLSEPGSSAGLGGGWDDRQAYGSK